jgi:hypothetical protein
LTVIVVRVDPGVVDFVDSVIEVDGGGGGIALDDVFLFAVWSEKQKWYRL